MTTENYHFKVGTLQCIAISDGTDVNTVENLIRDVPPELVRQATLDHGLSPTEITTYFNCLYIQTDRQRVLVDAGWGQGTGRRNGALLEGLQVEGITSSGEHLLHLADAVGHPILMEHPGWHWSYDAGPEQAEKDRRQLLNQAVTWQALVFGSHLPFPGIGRVIPRGEGWKWQPLE